jgi:Uma2 family endonuclease
MIVRQREILTADEFLHLPDEKDFELVDGHLVERHMGAESGYLEAIISARLAAWGMPRQGFVIGSSGGYQCFPDRPNQVIRPVVSFVRRGRLPGDVVPAGWIDIPPDLAVEVVSPTDEFSEVVEKVTDYLEAGVPLVWVVDPTRRELYVYRPHRRPEVLQAGDELRDEPVLSDFTCRVGELFGLTE